MYLCVPILDEQSCQSVDARMRRGDVNSCRWTNLLDVFDQISRDVSDKVTKVILVQLFTSWGPETDVLETGRVSGIRTEGRDYAILELREKTRVSRPK